MKKQQDFSYSLTVKASTKEAMEKISQVNLWWADKKIVWLVTDCNLHWIKDKKEWKNTETIWTLTRKGGKTQIDFAHKGLTPDSECYESCKPGWTHHLEDSLVKLIDEGRGSRNKDMSLRDPGPSPRPFPGSGHIGHTNQIAKPWEETDKGPVLFPCR